MRAIDGDNTRVGGHLQCLMNRRTFVGASVVVGGAVAAGPLLVGCGDDEDRDQATSSVVRMQINGEQREIGVDNRTSLLDMLRERADLTGTKKGCDQGACGACTILVNGQRINSCLTLAVMHDGAEITTIEGLEQNGRLHRLQQAFIDEDAFQCGSCTAGQINVRPGVHSGGPHRISRGDPGMDERQHMPLRRLHQHRRRSRRRGTEHVEP